MYHFLDFEIPRFDIIFHFPQAASSYPNRRCQRRVSSIDANATTHRKSRNQADVFEFR